MEQSLMASSEAADVAKTRDPSHDSDPAETVRIEVDLGSLFEQFAKSKCRNKQDCSRTTDPAEPSTTELRSPGNLLKVDGNLKFLENLILDSLNEVLLQFGRFIESSASLIDYIEKLHSKGFVIDNASPAAAPNSTSANEQWLISPMCNDYCPVFIPLITERQSPQYFCEFTERPVTFWATYIFRSYSQGSVYQPPQVVELLIESNRLSVAEQFHVVKQPWISPSKVAKLFQSSRSIGNFGLKKRLTKVLSKLVTPRHRTNSESMWDCENLNSDVDLPLDALAASQYIQIVEADLDSPMHWCGNDEHSVECSKQESKTHNSNSRERKMLLYPKSHGKEMVKRRWRSGALFGFTDTDSLLPNDKGTGCKVDMNISIPKIDTSIKRGISLLTSFKVKRHGSIRVSKKTSQTFSSLGRLRDFSCVNQSINEFNGYAQLVNVDVQARSESRSDHGQKTVISKNLMRGVGYPLSRGDVIRACKRCSTSAYRGRLETSSTIHLLKADARMPSLLQNTADNYRRQIRMPKAMNHARRMYTTSDDTSGEGSAE
ncbi:unnamed protein product [Hydatigera taeniaeformis]|uniref:Protein kinase domain-containing protein n=1 Tax=Hydatigena taeniaeformis TaxID=6205 RepID=A0A0R3WKS4_HYDTA|nr:unnamed protein product [Hydatigera taeniaeformis]